MGPACLSGRSPASRLIPSPPPFPPVWAWSHPVPPWATPSLAPGRNAVSVSFFAPTNGPSQTVWTFFSWPAARSMGLNMARSNRDSWTLVVKSSLPLRPPLHSSLVPTDTAYRPIASAAPSRSPGLVAGGLGLAIQAYQFAISPALHALAGPGCGCRFTPTCSHYALEAVRTHGASHGTSLAARRLLRCHPWHPGGHDPVP